MNTPSTPVLENVNNKANGKQMIINRALYAAFTLTGILFWIFGSDKGNALAQLGIALAFDPFNPQQPFGQRPLFQKLWLLIHLFIVMAGVVWQILN